MKKFLCAGMALVMTLASSPFNVLAEIGERGVFTGITEGIALPKTTEQILAQTGNNARREQATLNYSEMVFLSGTAQRFDGTMTIAQNGGVSETEDAGTFTVSYVVAPNPGAADAANEQAVTVNRNLTLRVNYRKVESSGQKQVIYDYAPTAWQEAIEVGGATYTLEPARSHFGRSIVEDITPGVSYYKGQSSQTLYYASGDGNGAMTVVETSGSIYGYNSPWSKTETERVDIVVKHAGGWQLEAQTRPSVSVNKVLQYSPNEPTAISFDGSYYEVLKNQSVLSYNIYALPLQFQRNTVTSGSVTIPNVNSFEMLTAPDLAFLKGNFAESDIKKLFAMQVFEGVPNQFQPAQAMTRAQFVTALVKAFKLPVEQVEQNARNRRTPVVTVLFPDVQSNRADFPYLMAAYKSGIVYGRYAAENDNRFRPDDPITMEEAIVMLMRGLGLENLGLTPTTVTMFSDDAKISSWAKREVAAAQRAGIIDMDINGNINPQSRLTKAAGAALVNSLIDYMRTELPTDYVEHILNFAN